MKLPALLVLTLAFAAACSGARNEPQDKGYSISGRDPFRFLVDPDVLREWGGPGSPKFNQVLEEELKRLGICRHGYALRNEGTRDGVFSVSGRCKS